MKLNPKVTGALAWTGLVLVLAVPAADMIVGKPDASANLVSDTKQVKPVAAKPDTVKPDATQTASITPATGSDPVADFVKSGKKLPSYISGSDAPSEVAALPATPGAKPVTTPAVKPVKPGTITVNPDGTITRPDTAKAPVAPAAATGTETGVASIRPDLVAPVPLPASARPKARPVQNPPLIVEDDQVALNEVVEPLLDPAPAPVIESDQLEEWDSGSLADYLRRKGLLEQSGSSSASVRADGSYDPDGYFLDQGPNQPPRSRVIVIDRGRDYW